MMQRRLKCETTPSAWQKCPKPTMALRCELVARKNHLAWKWAAATSWMFDDGVEIAKMAVGRDFVIYLLTSGQLKHCGVTPRKLSYEKLRLRQDKRRSRAHAIGAELKRLSTRERELYDGHNCDSTCCPIELPMAVKIRVQQVACGATHCVALGENGGVDGMQLGLFSWGLGEYGQLGLGEWQFASTMTPITLSKELRILLHNTDQTHPLILRCGVFSTYLLGRGSSTLWHWGLLPSDSKDSPFVRQGVPVRFPLLDENIALIDVSVGVEHVVLLSENGCVFTWGYGRSGQLGLGPAVTSNVDSEHPTQVDFFRHDTDHRIVAISCGWNHTVAVSRSGEVYAWGNNAFGACGAKSKFCEYFQPVLVAVPHSACMISSNRYMQVRCGGNSSAFLILRHVNESYCIIERAFVWGVGAVNVGSLLPLELFSCVDNQSKFTDLCVGWGILASLRANNNSSLEVCPAWVVKDVSTCGDSRQGIEKGMPYLHVGLGARIRIQLQSISKSATNAIINLSDEGDRSAKLFELSVQQNNGACVAIYSVTRQIEGSSKNATAEVILVSQSKGRATISLVSSIGGIVGGNIVVDVAQTEHETQTIAIAPDENGNEGKIINVLGIHVEGCSTESQEHVDTNWYKLYSNCIRVHTDDTVVVLVESGSNDMDPAVQVEFRDNHWQYGLTHLDIVGDSESRHKNLGVVQLRFPSPGQYFIYHTQHPEYEHDHRPPLLVVSCCVSSQNRELVLTTNHGLVWSKYQSASTEAPPSAHFSFFLSSVLQHATLRDAVVCSPWAATSEEELSEPPFDFDREHDAQCLLLANPERPFVLWGPQFDTSSTLDTPYQLLPDQGSLSLCSILPAWADKVSSKVAFRIATWLGKPYARSKESSKPIDYQEVRSKAADTGLSVKQIPFDFLGSVTLMNQCAVRDALAPVISNIVGVYDSIVSWRRSNGDLFYSVQSNDLVVRRYGHESHDFPETAKSGRISRLKSQLTDFLWQIGEGKKIEELFSLFTTPSKQDAQPPNPSKTCVKTVIHLRELIFHSTSCGFAEVIAVPKEEWFALFRGMQELSPPNCAGITFSAFRTFLVDPFHQFFWKQYVHQIREQANSNRELINRALLESFEASKGLTHGGHRSNNEADSTDGIIEETFMVPWQDFVESLTSFHMILGLTALCPSDCCRLLYRFDIQGNGRISIQTFRDTLLHALDDIDAATNEFDFTKSRTSKPSHALNGKRPLKVAIATGHRRPDLELFTSSEAVHKLFAARANIRPDNSTRTKTTSTSTNVVTALRASANTHLARIRNLPISHLLREGVNFRPSRRDLYHCDDEKGSTQAEAMGAEESY